MSDMPTQSDEEAGDPGVLINERQRVKSLTKRKLRPRDFFDVQGIMERREQKAI